MDGSMRALAGLAIVCVAIPDIVESFRLASEGLGFTEPINRAILTVSIADLIILSQYLKPIKIKKKYKKPFLAWPLI